MASYVALLRGIAPMNPKMKNAALVPVFEKLSLKDVRAVASSGNVLFSTDDRSATKLEDRIEAALHEHLGAECLTIVRSQRQIERLTKSDVFAEYSDGPAERCNVTFLKQRSAEAHTTPEARPDAHVVAVRDQAVFTVFDTTTGTTPRLMADLEKLYGKRITTRTWKMVHRIAAAFDR